MDKLVDGYARRLIDTYKATRRAEQALPLSPQREQISKAKDEVLDTLIGYLEQRVERLNKEKRERLCN